MIFVGIDLVEIDRIRKLISSKGQKFISHIYSESEINYCFSKIDPAIHFAGRFSAKEAVKKALLSSKLLETVILKDIIIDRDASGIPKVILINKRNIRGKINISISHTKNYATSIAIFEIIT